MRHPGGERRTRRRRGHFIEEENVVAVEGNICIGVSLLLFGGRALPTAGRHIHASRGYFFAIDPFAFSLSSSSPGWVIWTCTHTNRTVEQSSVAGVQSFGSAGEPFRRSFGKLERSFMMLISLECWVFQQQSVSKTLSNVPTSYDQIPRWLSWPFWCAASRIKRGIKIKIQGKINHPLTQNAATYHNVHLVFTSFSPDWQWRKDDDLIEINDSIF